MTKALIGLSIIFAMQLLGTLLSHFVIPILPGSVVGMILLFLALQLGWVKECHLDSVVSFFMSNMTIFFLPSAVGIITVMPLVSNNLFAIALSVVLSTIVVLLGVGFIQQYFDRKRGDANDS
ncbi:MAG: CidA/LrgA family protein [Rikenellaceae bacterium]